RVADMSTPSRQLTNGWHPSEVPETLLLPAPEEALTRSALFLSSGNLWYVLSRRRWTILGVTFLLTTIAAVASYLMTPIFRAVARLEIEPETPLLQSLNEVFQRADADDMFLQTQIQVLKSDNLAWRTIEQLSLAKSLEVFPPGDPTKEEIEQQKVKLI